MMARLTPPASPRTALTVWGVAVLCYILAIAGRSSFGVASLAALERFDVGPAILSTFVVLQVGTYAAAQIPVGLAIDRWGPRRVLVAGALLLAAAQTVMALSTVLPLTLAARVAVGLGDATAFISVLRLVPEWFAMRHVPLVNQATGALGQLGQVVSAVPFYAVLRVSGWSVAHLSLAATGVLVAIAVLVVVRDRPAADPGSPGRARTAPAAPPAGRTGVRHALREVAREPGVWAGLFAHWSTMFFVSTFALMWGVPYMRAGNGHSAATASTVLVLGVVAMALSALLVGTLSARFPRLRLRLVVTGSMLAVTTWTVVLLVPPPVPAWLLAVLMMILSLGGAASNVSFDVVRAHVPRSRLGTATGLANSGGFVATLLAVLLVGVVLDVVGGSSPGPEAFRVAMASQAAVVLVGLTGLLLATRRLGPGSESAPRRG
ncbi:MFS transporter [Georgenia sp. Z1491]|uniref:MFS transporter n=1 Tax=Georgenia sp. Z1491 TaxID=3416707 RepID=UPI003CE99FA8